MRRAALAMACVLLIPSGEAAAGTPLRDAYLKRFLGRPAPPFSVRSVKGGDVKLSDYRGRVVLLNFWYSACFPCREETPALMNLYRTYESRGLMVLGINIDAIIMAEDKGRTLRSFLASYDIPYPVLMADRKLYDDYGRPSVAPITLLVDARGTIAQVFWGATYREAFETAVRPYLDARATGAPATGAAPSP
jgi:cytochrome c biogenesis protein CcmG, thiol:disulfide interchange protein DsbE